ncbi:hypothetical protein OO012_08150 [Rhodobacteraceae bacterium KMM 6894]|nr:hypothetical protein [Rhodobacteraceae bacterium KMM 6894]
MELLIGLMSGALGGTLVGGRGKSRSLGLFLNSLTGIAGGGLAVKVQTLLGPSGLASRGVDIISLAEQVATGAAGGAALVIVLGFATSPLRG